MATPVVKLPLLGELQLEVQSKTKALKRCTQTLQRARDAYDAAEEEYHQARKALACGTAQVQAATRVIT